MVVRWPLRFTNCTVAGAVSSRGMEIVTSPPVKTETVCTQDWAVMRYMVPVALSNVRTWAAGRPWEVVSSNVMVTLLWRAMRPKVFAAWALKDTVPWGRAKVNGREDAVNVRRAALGKVTLVAWLKSVISKLLVPVVWLMIAAVFRGDRSNITLRLLVESHAPRFMVPPFTGTVWVVSQVGSAGSGWVGGCVGAGGNVGSVGRLSSGVSWVAPCAGSCAPGSCGSWDRGGKVAGGCVGGGVGDCGVRFTFTVSGCVRPPRSTWMVKLPLICSPWPMSGLWPVTVMVPSAWSTATVMPGRAV